MPLTPLTDRKGGGVVDCPTQLNFMTWNCQLCSMINTSEKYERTQRGNLLGGLNAYGQPDRKYRFFYAPPKGRRQWKKTFSFGHCPNYLNPPPPSPQFGQLGPLFSDVKIQDLKVSLELRILYVLYNILYICNLKNS